MTEPKEHFRKLEPFTDAKKRFTLNIIVHFFTEDQPMKVCDDGLLVKNDAKIVFTDYLFSFEREAGVEIASGRFMDLKKIKIESGLLGKNEMTFLKGVIKVLVKSPEKELPKKGFRPGRTKTGLILN